MYILYGLLIGIAIPFLLLALAMLINPDRDKTGDAALVFLMFYTAPGGLVLGTLLQLWQYFKN